MINLNYVLVNPTNIAYIKRDRITVGFPPSGVSYYWRIIIGWQGGAELKINYSVLEQRDNDHDYLMHVMGGLNND